MNDQPNERPTPETDELEIIMDQVDTPPSVKLMPYAHLCRRLERDLAEAREQLRAESNLAYERTRLYHDEWNKNAELIDELAAERASRFTIAEVADYIAGWHLSTGSGALANALSQLHDDQDGILAVRERKHSLENA